jgi:hypothetical protein
MGEGMWEDTKERVVLRLWKFSYGYLSPFSRARVTLTSYQDLCLSWFWARALSPNLSVTLPMSPVLCPQHCSGWELGREQAFYTYVQI